MTNPSNMVRVRARNGGRASVYEANGWCQGFTSGLLDGSGVIQNTPADLNVLVGGSATNPDVVLAVNPAGYRVALDIVSQQVVALTTPASNSRISSIVAYTDDLALPTTEDTVTGSPASCGLIVVNGTAAANPTAPNDTQIRSAITADGATGSQAAYCVIANVLVANDATAITNSEITIQKSAITASKIDFSTFGDGNYSTSETNTGFTWVDGSPIYKKTINFGTLPNATSKTVAHNITNLKRVIRIEGYAYHPTNHVTYPIPFASKDDPTYNIGITADETSVEIGTGLDRSYLTECYITLHYIKTS